MEIDIAIRKLSKKKLTQLFNIFKAGKSIKGWVIIHISQVTVRKDGSEIELTAVKVV